MFPETYLLCTTLSGMRIKPLTCPRCGWLLMNMEEVLPHIDKYHALGGQEDWRITEVPFQGNPAVVFFILSDYPLAPEMKKAELTEIPVKLKVRGRKKVK
jgi:hypothetical protein